MLQGNPGCGLSNPHDTRRPAFAAEGFDLDWRTSPLVEAEDLSERLRVVVLPQEGAAGEGKVHVALH